MRDAWLLAADILTLMALPAPFVFVALYSRSPWRSTSAGRALMTTVFALAVLIVTIGLTLWLGTDYPGRPVVRILAYGFVTYSLWRLVVTLFRIQRKSRRSPSDAETRPKHD